MLGTVETTLLHAMVLPIATLAVGRHDTPAAGHQAVQDGGPADQPDQESPQLDTAQGGDVLQAQVQYSLESVNSVPIEGGSEKCEVKDGKPKPSVVRRGEPAITPDPYVRKIAEMQQDGVAVASTSLVAIVDVAVASTSQSGPADVAVTSTKRVLPKPPVRGKQYRRPDSPDPFALAPLITLPSEPSSPGDTEKEVKKTQRRPYYYRPKEYAAKARAAAALKRQLVVNSPSRTAATARVASSKRAASAARAACAALVAPAAPAVAATRNTRDNPFNDSDSDSSASAKPTKWWHALLCGMCSLGGLFFGCLQPIEKLRCCGCFDCSRNNHRVPVQAAVDEQPKSRHPPGVQEPLIINHEITRPTKEEIRAWGTSFDEVMRSEAGRMLFRDFLRGEYSEENIMFWLACEELKRETDPQVIKVMARLIYEDYISVLSPKEVSLDSQVRDVINATIDEPTVNCFDEAQLQIYTLMRRDSYPRFVNSALFKALA